MSTSRNLGSTMPDGTQFVYTQNGRTPRPAPRLHSRGVVRRQTRGHTTPMATLRQFVLPTLLFLCLPALCHSAALARDARGSLRPLRKVFGRDRLQVEDVVYLVGGATLKGTIINKTIIVHTPYGECNVPLRHCAAISMGHAAANREAVVTETYDRMTGVVSTGVFIGSSFRMKLADSGELISIPKHAAHVIVLAQKHAPGSSLELPEGNRFFVMINGDVLGGRFDETPPQFRTKFGSLPLT